MSKKADIGLIGLAVMGENLVMNMESKGFSVAVYNRTLDKVDAFINGRGKGKNIIGTHSIEELCASLSQVTAGLAEEMQKLSTSVRSIESGVVDGLEKEISNLSDSVATSISNHLEQQMKAFERQSLAQGQQKEASRI